MSTALGIPGAVIPAAAAAASSVGTLSYQGYGKTGNRVFPAGLSNCIASFGAAFTVNILRALPWIARVDGTIDQFSVDVTAGVATSVSRFGIYANVSRTDPRPGALLWESGSIATATTGVYVTAPVTGVTVAAGDLLWCAMVNGVASGGVRALQSAESGLLSVVPILGFIDAVLGGTRGGVGFTLAHAYAALPNPFGAGTLLEATSGVLLPYLCLRYA